MSAPSTAQINFARAVLARLSLWPVLRIAVESSWGGPESKEKRSWMVGEIIDAFETQQPPPDQDYIEEFLLQMLSDEFDTVVDDESSGEVARDLMALWSDVASGNIEESMLKLEERERKVAGKKVQVQFAQTGQDTEWVDGDSDEDGEDSDATEMEVDEVPQLVDQRAKPEPVIDEDGFTLVQTKKQKHQ